MCTPERFHRLAPIRDTRTGTESLVMSSRHLAQVSTVDSGSRANPKSKQGWKFAAGAARVSDEEDGSTDAGNTSCGVFVATLPQLGAVTDENEGAVCSTPGDGRIVQAWVNIVEAWRVSAVYFCRSDG